MVVHLVVVAHVQDALREEKRVVWRCYDPVGHDVVDESCARGTRVRQKIHLDRGGAEGEDREARLVVISVDQEVYKVVVDRDRHVVIGNARHIAEVVVADGLADAEAEGRAVVLIQRVAEHFETLLVVPQKHSLEQMCGHVVPEVRHYIPDSQPVNGWLKFKAKGRRHEVF
eukprot:CAMPEP_0177718342 /NCGR_PEP_ID=MMETSP0484_2-20121128/15527_1 /TAXON_ID=354590 /ORGANISM="Rhodomonas lens, Strain RHODO" /LENGTH=170 /DNA_ID=CAMNT_0019230503 /DNA_START=487 /DNA_END=999 /DNA_ORIENTATION=+